VKQVAYMLCKAK